MIGVERVIAIAGDRGALNPIESDWRCPLQHRSDPDIAARWRGVAGAAGSVSRSPLDDVKAIAKINPGIVRVDGNVSGSAQVVYADKNANTVSPGPAGYGVMRNGATLLRPFFHGGGKSDQDVSTPGQTVVNICLGKQNPVGQTIKINHIGFYGYRRAADQGGHRRRDQDDMILMPLYAAMNRVLGKKYLNNIYIECASPDSIPSAINDIAALMRKRHRLPAYKDNDF